jgi:hypothetical protein
MGTETLNTNLLKMLSHLSKYPIPDPQMVRDFKWFVKHYNLSVGDGVVTPPNIGGNNVVTVKETTLTFNGGALSKVPTNNPDGLVITPGSLKAIYSMKILIEGTTSETFSYNNGLDVGITLGSEEIVGETLAEGDTPAGEPFPDPIKIFCDDAAVTANTLSTLSVTIKLYTA